MWLLDKFFDILKYFGLFKRTARILFIGLDNAGKTTLLHMLRYGRLVQHAPTARPTSETISLGPIDFTTFDLGGHRAARAVWRQYYDVADAFVFLIDATDFDRFVEARKELRGLLEDAHFESLPILILGNKIDRPDAMSQDQLTRVLGIENMINDGSMDDTRPLKIVMCSVVKKEGYGDGFRWLANVLNERM